MRRRYSFSIAFPVDRVIQIHREILTLPSRDDAYAHFVVLLRRCRPGGFLYLCKWGLKSKMDQLEFKYRP